jgi:hypothetical protein
VPITLLSLSLFFPSQNPLRRLSAAAAAATTITLSRYSNLRIERLVVAAPSTFASSHFVIPLLMPSLFFLQVSRAGAPRCLIHHQLFFFFDVTRDIT